MALEGVPLYIGGDTAQHNADVSRVLPFAAFNGNEGIVRPTHHKVHELSTPGTSVNVDPGACAIIARAPGQLAQSYVWAFPTAKQLAVPPSDSSGSRHHLVIIRVEDPYDGSGKWPVPSDEVNGPYIYVRLIEDVPAGTTDIHNLEGTLGVMSAITLARIDVPTSESTIINDYITHLRELANPFKDFLPKSQRHSNDTLITPFTTSPVEYPQENNHFTPVVPPRATRMNIRYDIVTASAVSSDSSANLYGNQNILVDGSNVPGFSEWNFDWNGGAARFNMTAFADDVDVSGSQGQTVDISSEIYMQGGAGELHEDNGTNTFLQVYFYEEPV